MIQFLYSYLVWKCIYQIKARFTILVVGRPKPLNPQSDRFVRTIIFAGAEKHYCGRYFVLDTNTEKRLVAKSQTKKLILLVGHSTKTKILLKKSLEEAGFETLISNSSEEAVEFLSIAIVDGIVTALVLPDGSGVDLCDQIEANTTTAHIATTVLTYDSEPLEFYKQLGMSHHYSSPTLFCYEDFIEKMKELIWAKRVTLEKESERVYLVKTIMTTINHEINNPLAIIQGNLHRITRAAREKDYNDIDELNVKCQEQIATIVIVLKTLSTLVDLPIAYYSRDDGMFDLQKLKDLRKKRS